MLTGQEVGAAGSTGRSGIRATGAMVLAVWLALSGFGVRAQEAGGDGTPGSETRTPVVAVLGASVSAGFVDPRPRPDGERNEGIRIRELLPALWPDREIRIVDQSEMATFTNPVAIQEVRVERVLDESPDLVVAIDFPFWFGYGRHRNLESRLQQQAEAFAMLESFEVPCFAGDYPDMSSADPGMLPASMIPDRDGIAALNRGFASWVEGAEHVHPVALAAFVAQAREQGLDVRYGDQDLHLTTEHLMQADRLHASPLGAAVLVFKLGERMREVLPEEHPLRPPVPDLRRLVRAADVEWQVDEILEAKRETPKPDSAGKRKKAG